MMGRGRGRVALGLLAVLLMATGCTSGNRLPRGDGPYRHARADTHPAAVQTIQEILDRTMREQVPATLREPERNLPLTCFDGDGFWSRRKDNGLDQQEMLLLLDVTGPASASAAIPALATYWAELGLEVNTEDLDTGLPRVSARLPGVGGVAANTIADSSTFMALRGYTECKKP
jgi:hypothetical protein